MIRSAPWFALATLSLAAAGSVHAQQATSSSSIYSCTDAKGHTITSDRPIPACIDRQQTELQPSGARRTIEPTYTQRELAEREEKERQAALVAARATEERRRERALLVRYPNQATHDRERADALAQIDVVVQAAKKRVAELAEERKKVDEELEFYKKDLSKAPESLRRKLDDNTQSVAVQNRFIGEQEDEKRRVNARFDEERARLRSFWSASAGSATR